MPKVRNYMKRKRSNRKGKSSISVGRVERLIFQITNRGLFLIRSSEGDELVVSGAEARRLGYNLNCFDISSDGIIEGHSFVERTSQPHPVVRKLEELEKFAAVIVFNGALHPNESSKGVFAPTEDERELMKKGPAGRANTWRKARGVNERPQGESKNQGHTAPAVHDSKGWKSKKMLERNPNHWSMNSNR